jgi:hypothetical protein
MTSQIRCSSPCRSMTISEHGGKTLSARPSKPNRFGGLELKADRVDIRQSGDSILTLIADGIAHSQLILADISVTDRWRMWWWWGQEHYARNGNVMYEVGLAMACRQPVEVVLVRDDNESLLFDVSPIPVLRYDPQDAVKSIGLIRKVLADRLQERGLIKDMRVTATRDALSQFELNIIRAHRHLQFFCWEGVGLPAVVAIALPQLLEKRVLDCARRTRYARSVRLDDFWASRSGLVTVAGLTRHTP